MGTETKAAPSRAGVTEVFDRIAPTYDVLNRWLSFRRDVAWRKVLVDAIPQGQPVELLDLATGTGDVLVMAGKRCRNLARALGVDMSRGMLDCARGKLTDAEADGPFELQQGDATDLALEDASFDAVTIAFGIRNVTDTPRALAEMHRVLKPGGKVLVLEFSLPSNACVRGLYLLFFRHILPRVGGWVSGDRGAYRYLNQTVETYPYGEAFTSLMADAGFTRCESRPLTLGIATLYTGWTSV